MGGTYFNKRSGYMDFKTRKPGAKTFKTEEAAKVYAEANGIKNYKLENLKSPEASVKKIRIVLE